MSVFIGIAMIVALVVVPMFAVLIGQLFLILIDAVFGTQFWEGDESD